MSSSLDAFRPDGSYELIISNSGVFIGMPWADRDHRGPVPYGLLALYPQDYDRAAVFACGLGRVGQSVPPDAPRDCDSFSASLQNTRLPPWSLESIDQLASLISQFDGQAAPFWLSGDVQKGIIAMQRRVRDQHLRLVKCAREIRELREEIAELEAQAENEEAPGY